MEKYLNRNKHTLGETSHPDWLPAYYSQNIINGACMKVRLKPLSSDNPKEIVDIFNYYVENGFAAYAENKLPYEFFKKLQEMCHGYPAVIAEDNNGKDTQE